MDSIIYKDIIKRFHVRAMTGMEDLARYVISNSAAEYSFNTLAKVTQCKSVHTVEKYLRYLETAFVVFSLRRFSFSLRKQGGFNKKIYCVDNGFITSKGFKLSPDIGRMCENCVAIELKKRELERKVEFFFWKNPQHEEVDFVVKKNHSLSHLIQVCWNFSDPKTKNREIRALLKAGKELSCSNLIILSEKGEGTETVEHFGMKGEIQFLPIWKWLLNPGL